MHEFRSIYIKMWSCLRGFLYINAYNAEKIQEKEIRRKTNS